MRQVDKVSAKEEGGFRGHDVVPSLEWMFRMLHTSLYRQLQGYSFHVCLMPDQKIKS